MLKKKQYLMKRTQKFNVNNFCKNLPLYSVLENLNAKSKTQLCQKQNIHVQKDQQSKARMHLLLGTA